MLYTKYYVRYRRIAIRETKQHYKVLVYELETESRIYRYTEPSFDKLLKLTNHRACRFHYDTNTKVMVYQEDIYYEIERDMANYRYTGIKEYVDSEDILDKIEEQIKNSIELYNRELIIKIRIGMIKF